MPLLPAQTQSGWWLPRSDDGTSALRAPLAGDDNFVWVSHEDRRWISRDGRPWSVDRAPSLAAGTKLESAAMFDTTTAAGASTHSDDSIYVTLPPRAELASTLRVIAASLGADAGFSVEEIDDLRLAVSEVFTLLVEADHDEGARCTTRFGVRDNVVGVTLARPGVHDAEPLALDQLAATILSSVVDEYSVDSSGVRLVKHAADSPSNDL